MNLTNTCLSAVNVLCCVYAVVYASCAIHLVKSSVVDIAESLAQSGGYILFSTLSPSIHCQRCYLVLVLFHLVMVGRIIGRILQDVTVYIDGTTDVKQAKEVGHTRPLFAAAVIRNIIMVLTTSPLKSNPPREEATCATIKEIGTTPARSSSSPIEVLRRLHYFVDPDRDNPIGSTDGLTEIVLP